MIGRIIVSALLLLSVAAMTFLYTKEQRMEAKADKLDTVCDDVRELLCIVRNEIDHKPGYSDFHGMPNIIAVDACAPGVWNDWKISEAIKRGDYEQEVRSQVGQLIDAIPKRYDLARCGDTP